VLPCRSDGDGVYLTWRAIRCSRDDPKGKHPPKQILSGISGEAKPGRVLAILGPSGSGKTTLLNSLALRIPAAKGLKLSGEVLCNGRPLLPELAYVTQEDLFFSELSVEETLNFAAQMRLPEGADREEFIAQLLRKLSLGTTKSTRVGLSGGGNGVSGGERKRLSLGCELISTPKLILCDEPTSGLDAFQALRVMQSLKSLAEAGHTVIVSIHQPSSAVFGNIDDIVLLSGGRLVYQGDRATAPAHFTKAQLPVPPNCNPAEHYLDIISVDYTSDEATKETTERIQKLVETFAKKQPNGPLIQKDANGNTATVRREVSKPLKGPLGQFKALLLRAFRQAKRDKKTNVSRFMSSFMSSLLFGSIVNTAMSALVKTLNVFPREASLVNRERAKGAYGVLPYFTSKICAELPLSAFFPLVFSSMVYPMAGLSAGLGRISKFAGIITLESFASASYGLVIGALVPNTEIALAIGPSTFILQIIFGGGYLTQGNVPKWASYLPKLSLIKHAFEGLAVNELRGLEFEGDGANPEITTTGQQVLERLTWGDSTVSKSMNRLVRIIMFNYVAAFGILKMKQPRFQQMIHPSDAVEIEDVTDEDATSPVAADSVPNSVAATNGITTA